jgi:hypothetical protein
MNSYFGIVPVIAIIVLMLGMTPAQATPVFYNIVQSFQDGSTSKFNYTFDSQIFVLTNVSDVSIEDANGLISVPYQISEAIQTDPYGSAFLLFMYSSPTVNVLEALGYDGVTSVFNQAGASLTDSSSQLLIDQRWSMVAGGPDFGGSITLNELPLGVAQQASVPEPEVSILLTVGLLILFINARKRDFA